MNSKFDHLLDVLKSDFGQLWHTRIKGQTLEVVTPFCTSTNKFVTVFIKCQGDSFIVSDAGWLQEEPEAYGLWNGIWENGKGSDAIDYFKQVFSIKEVEHQRSRYFYAVAEDMRMLSNSVYNLSNFISSTVNATALSSSEQVEGSQQNRFRTKANRYLNEKFGDDNHLAPTSSVRFRSRLESGSDAQFSAIITVRSRLNLVCYVTGSTRHYFSNDIRRAIVNFQIAENSKFRSMVANKIAIFDDSANGYESYAASRGGDLEGLLRNQCSVAPVLWTQKDELEALIK